MPRRPYGWDPNGPAPVLEHHSKVKHEILAAYLSAYVQRLLSNPNKPELKLTLIDGFCGGGLYRDADTGADAIGSPLVMLKAMQEAEVLANVNRKKPVQFDIDYFFIDTAPDATAQLTHVLDQRGYAHGANTNVHIIRSKFELQAHDLIQHVNRRMPRSGRAIFLLDQYGYSEVPTSAVRMIMRCIPAAEVILTFNAASLLTYLTDKEGRGERLLKKAGVPEALRGRAIEDIKLNQNDWRLFIQASLYPELVNECGAPYFTPFFIRSDKGHGEYWFVHFSKHARARDVMTRIHWDKSNYFIHYGGEGLDMFGGPAYSPSLDSAVGEQTGLGFEFGNREQQASIEALARQIPEQIYSAPDEGILFETLFDRNCNSSPAHADIYREAIARLRAEKELLVFGGPNNREKKKGKIADGDRIVRPKQIKFSFPT